MISFSSPLPSPCIWLTDAVLILCLFVKPKTSLHIFSVFFLITIDNVFLLSSKKQKHNLPLLHQIPSHSPKDLHLCNFFLSLWDTAPAKITSTSMLPNLICKSLSIHYFIPQHYLRLLITFSFGGAL